MTKPPTLNELKRLEKSGFGKLYPRHGLKLLYWFAHECLYFDAYNRMCWQYDPEEGDFGFHRFENRNDEHGETLLPDVNLEYYEVGNLRRAGADELPDYVLDDYNQNRDHSDSNMDRIIVSVDDECFDRVYVTQHSDRTDFNKKATYCISRGLIMIIRRLTLNNFLLKTGYLTLRKDTDQGTGYLTLRKDTDQGTGYLTQGKDTDQGTGYLTQGKDTDLNTGYVRLVEDSKSENHCRCIIL
ncbi:uncharacterized protein LOC117596854 [Pangasianodon hypophthalmus]|uniref:uncharacterized protein LOC117596854 n=1 Tax=Pangasianodon hypophthalmus TaxID=310915 RepID=UPI002307C195|nr:uncharacterized protein LOC117596854 [Pangasianodon hypophthalmus]